MTEYLRVWFELFSGRAGLITVVIVVALLLVALASWLVFRE